MQHRKASSSINWRNKYLKHIYIYNKREEEEEEENEWSGLLLAYGFVYLVTE